MQNSVSIQATEPASPASSDLVKTPAKPAAPRAAKPASATPRKSAATPVTQKVATPLKKTQVAAPAATKAAASKAAAPGTPAAKSKPTKAPLQRPQKIKLVRDSFTFPEADHKRLVDLKKRVIALGIEVKKGELVRAALDMLASLDNQKLLKAIANVEKLKTGRPKK